MNNSLIKINNLSVSRNDHIIFSDISFDIVESHAINIYGCNGSGKTTLLKTILGITEPSSGNIDNSGIENLFEKIVYIGHKTALKNELTVSENLLFTQSICGEKDESLILYALSMYKMSKYSDTPIKLLSHGQKKRVSLMKTLITKSIIWIIDEPYSSLDEDGIDVFNSLAKKHLESRGALILTNHKPLEKTFEKFLNVPVGE